MSAAEFFKDLFVLTFSQIISLFAGIFVFGLLIHFISHFMFNSLGKAFGPAGTYLVAWLGTPIHELGHVIFCIIFGHKITRVELFSPDPKTGTLGYVNHEWHKSNPWQVLGNFFIGIGPIIVGSLALLGLFYLLAPNGSQAWDSIIAGANEIGSDNSISGYLAVLKDSFLVFTKSVFTITNISSWQFWVFCYLAICVASNIRLSLADMKSYHPHRHRQHRRSAIGHRQREVFPFHGFIPQHDVQPVYSRPDYDHRRFYPDLPDIGNLGKAVAWENP
jgi:hypothetical protein